ncbi:hypothetical protein [Polaromonas glacialis]|uniref:hypothetical protein n=1 Tax=Polaromonas glacialis TaxID=866564 RepID=UPI0012EB91E3|nr:hypothetical protein [Polaromonas glacialis]
MLEIPVFGEDFGHAANFEIAAARSPAIAWRPRPFRTASGTPPSIQAFKGQHGKMAF